MNIVTRARLDIVAAKAVSEAIALVEHNIAQAQRALADIVRRTTLHGVPDGLAASVFRLNGALMRQLCAADADALASAADEARDAYEDARAAVESAHADGLRALAETVADYASKKFGHAATAPAQHNPLVLLACEYLAREGAVFELGDEVAAIDIREPGKDALDRAAEWLADEIWDGDGSEITMRAQMVIARGRDHLARAEWTAEVVTVRAH